MVMFNRVIAALQLDNGRLVKTERQKKPKYVGDPLNTIKLLNEKFVDEILVLDISKNGIEPDFEILRTMSRQCFAPMSYGGKISNIEMAENLVQYGYERLSFQSAIFENPALMKQVSSHFGAQSVIACLDIKKDWLGRQKALSRKGGKVQSYSLDAAIAQLKMIEFGELIVCDSNRDGTFEGPNLELLNFLSQHFEVPLIYSGGIFSEAHIQEVFEHGAGAVAISSMVVFRGNRDGILISYPNIRGWQ